VAGMAEPLQDGVIACFLQEQCDNWTGVHHQAADWDLPVSGRARFPAISTRARATR
jgi:hypothetical protein